ncbi:Gfo/Idh/MocA family oxidoreductase, partial [Candidatus Poribacteria bacterium]|nr:Gfo/Idh/MocA family oxidoreductase [Candidatus Poribacteria bacterium]
MDKIAFGIVGSGWRAEFYLRIAAACPDRFDVVGVVARRKERGAELERAFGVRTFRSLDAMLEATSPTFVVTSVSWPANPVFVRDLVAKGVPVLSETPPAPDLDGMQSLYADVQAGGGVVQVAEQFHLQPHHAARLAFASGGKIGRVSQAQVSVSHGYHGVSLMRRLLGIGYENATIRARSFEEPGIAGASRDAPPTEEKVSTSRQQIAWCDFGDRLGVFDFTSDQYFS